MIKVFLPLLFLSVHVFAAGNTPDNQNGPDAVQFNARVFYIEENWTGLAEVQTSDQPENRLERSVLLGGYAHVSPNLRVGAFYRRQSGYRHNEDWSKDSGGNWRWEDTNGRGEDLVVLDVSPKFLLDFLPGEHWTFEFKTRVEHSFFDGDEAFRFRPSLNYFWIREGKPFLSFFLQQEQTLRLNHGAGENDERWTYLGVLSHQGPSWQAGVFAAKRWQSWSSPPEFTAATGATYHVSTDNTVAGVVLIFKFTAAEPTDTP